jgi:hypothetical protein
MNVLTTQTVQQQPQHQGLLHAVDHILDQEIRSPSAQATWDYGLDDRSRPVLNLTITDGLNGSANGQFTPGELAHEVHFRERVRQMREAMDRVRQWCQNTLPALYRDMKQWVLSSDPQCFIQDTLVKVNERMSGPYDAPGLEIWRATQVVQVRPIAIWIVGGEGRVDLIGPMDDFMLVFRHDEWFAIEPTNRILEKALSSSLFLDIFEASLS